MTADVHTCPREHTCALRWITLSRLALIGLGLSEKSPLGGGVAVAGGWRLVNHFQLQIEFGLSRTLHIWLMEQIQMRYI